MKIRTSSLLRAAGIGILLLAGQNLPAQAPHAEPRVEQNPFYDQTYLAWSEDGFNWTPEPTPAFRHASVPDIYVRSDGEFLLYWVDFSAMRGPHWEFIGFSSSEDGQNWSEPSRVEIQGLSGIKAVDPSVVEAEGLLRMYYFAPQPGEGPHQIHSAVSRDGGKSFVEEEGVRFEAPGITDPDLVQRKDGTWVMYLSRGSEILIARSPDGLHFEDAGAGVREGGVPGAVVLDDGRIRLFVTAMGGIRSLISQDGISFRSENGVRILSSPDTLVADPSVSRTKDGRWVMAFKLRPLSRG